ncbi:SRPBCC family protein [Streptacidiphilus sp. N1-12]|uniref:SRPBCC family protein n=2 Tax=Streptacidiphilus alkalitolerans TaxID=3342712 RepID=A0ABV6VAP4_9ACTN
MDVVTGAQVAVAVTVRLARERMWELVTAVDRIGEWSPEALDGAWDSGADGPGPVSGDRFTACNRFADGSLGAVTCVVTEAERPSAFAWTVLDGAGLVGSTWRYELRDGDEPGSTRVRHSFTHGPGVTGARIAAEADPEALNRRLVTLCRNMTTTITAMASPVSTASTANADTANGAF